jgi:hypothetical protein
MHMSSQSLVACSACAYILNLSELLCTHFSSHAMLARDLLNEQAALHGATLWATKRARTTGGAKMARVTDDLVDRRRALGQVEFNQLTCATVVVRIGDEAADFYVAQGTREECDDLQSAGGMYFNTGIVSEGNVVWKSVDLIYGVHFFLFRSGRGWWCADNIWDSKAEDEVTPKVLLWCEAVEQDLPGGVHFPYWSKKIDPSITVMTGYDNMVDMVNEIRKLKTCSDTDPPTK